MKVLNYTGLQNLWTNIKNYITAHTPTKTSDLTNDSNFVDTSNSAVASGITSAKVTDYDTHIADTDIHVTTADKNKWNNQTYVFRYSSTALVASSTNSNALLDNTDNLKVGDKVIDSSGVLFSITAIDTQNSTFTIGTALVDLAQDSDVVHTSGDETVGGRKTFSENITCFSNFDAKSIICKTPLSTYDSTNTVGDNTKIRFLDKNNNSISYIMQRKLTNGSTDISLNVSNTDSNNQPIEATLTFVLDSANEPRLSPGIDNTISIGRPTFRYKSFYGMNYYYGSNNVEFSTKFVTTDTNQTISGNKTFSSINGVEPSSLSLPSDRSARIDISSYITNLGNGDTNQYTVPANGYIWLHFTSINGVLCYSQTSGGLTNYAQTFVRYQGDGQLYAFFPVRKDDYFIVQIYTSSTAVVRNAYFIPCQGNV